MIILLIPCCIYIVVQCVFCINKMSGKTSSFIWLWHVLIATSALLFLLQMLHLDMMPSPAGMLMILGVTLKSLSDRRGCKSLVKAEG
jgi:hypothetical protein